ncbi:MAG: flagellar motor protein MotB [bacterium]|nr:flagellar motor protein MotB [bacterium]
MARERKKPEPDNELRWLTTYGDVVTLLLAFFVMLYAISQVDQQKFELFVTGLADPFDNPAASEGFFEQGNGIVGAAFGTQQIGEDALEGIALLDGLPELNEQTDVSDTSLPPGGGDPDVLENDHELAEAAVAVLEALSEAGLGDAATFEITQRGLTIAIATDDVLFSSGSAEFGERGAEIISAIAPILQGFNNDVLVEGHTDTVPLNADGYDNWNLSADRALAVLRLLVDNHGIAPQRMAASGYGEYRPKADNATDNGKATNRRVELVIVLDRGENNG